MRKLPTFYRKVTQFLFKGYRHDFSYQYPVWNFGTLAAITITLCGMTSLTLSARNVRRVFEVNGIEVYM